MFNVDWTGHLHSRIPLFERSNIDLCHRNRNCFEKSRVKQPNFIMRASLQGTVFPKMDMQTFSCKMCYRTIITRILSTEVLNIHCWVRVPFLK